MRSLKLSFAGGEVSPEMVGRLDTRQSQTGVARCQNYLPLPQGPVTRRPGSRYVADQYTSGESHLIPFVYSTDQAMVIEMRGALFRFFTGGQQLLYATPRNMGASGWDTTANTATFLAEHGFSSNDEIQFTVPDTYALPTGLQLGTSYYVIVVDSYTIQVSASAGPGAAQPLSGSPTGYARAFLRSDFPSDFIVGSSGATTVDAANDRFALTAHPFAVGDAIQLVGVSTPVFPTTDSTGELMQAATTYYVSEIDTNWYKIALTKGGATETLGGSPAGTFTTQRYYVQGDLFYWHTGTLADGVYYCKGDHLAETTEPDTNYTWPQLDDGQLTIPSPYAEADMPAVHYAQSNDVVTLTHEDYAPRELRRLGAKNWDLRTISFGSTLTVPVMTSVVASRGARITIVAAFNHASGRANYQFSSEHGLAKGDVVYVDVTTAASGLTTDGYYIVNAVENTTEVSLKTEAGAVLQWAAGTPAAVVYFASLSADNSQTYKVTAVSPDGVETVAQASGTSVTNNLDVSGASNTITWERVTGADRYRVYKEQNGLYGYVGESEETGAGSYFRTFIDDGIATSLDRTPPIEDDSLSGTDYPRAVGYFEQRRVFGGTPLKPRQLWMTRSGTESDLTHSLPIKDDDRISVALAAREAATIRHVVPLGDLVLLTQQGEWRVTAVNSDAITPETIAVRQQSEIGASNVRPLVVNNSIVFAANRGGHVRTMSYNWQAQGYATGDLSLRATHLFDGLTIQDSTYSKAPYPVLWFVSSSGKLLSLTYVPEEEVAGWAVHDVGGTIESVCSIPEGDQDSVYMVVKRTVNGTEARYIERMVPQVTESLTDSIYLDASATYDGLETAGRTIKLTGGSLWDVGETVTITASTHLFKDRTDVGNEIELRDALGGRFRVRVSAYVSSTVATGVLLHDVPTAMQRTSVTTWAFARKEISGLSHLEGETVAVVSDGVVLPLQTVASGAITLPSAGAKVHVGHSFTSEVQTLPLALQQVDGAGQGRAKNIGEVYVRVLESAGMTVGQDAADLVPLEDMSATTLTTGEQRAVPPGKWSQDASIIIRQDQPLPSTVLGLTLNTQLGG